VGENCGAENACPALMETSHEPLDGRSQIAEVDRLADWRIG